jgi:hypothetical protein
VDVSLMVRLAPDARSSGNASNARNRAGGTRNLSWTSCVAVAA